MSLLLTLVIGLLTGIVGLFATYVLALLIIDWYRVSSFEGRAGYIAVVIALLGGIAGVVVGIIAATVVAGWPDVTFVKGLGVATGSMVSLVFLVGVSCRIAADIPPKIDGKDLELEVEVRSPRGFTLDFPQDEHGARYHLSDARGKNRSFATIPLDTARKVDGHLVFAGSVDLDTSSRGKRLRAYFNEQNDALFVLPLRGHPKKADLDWSHWLQAGWCLDQPEPSDDESFWLRYRVVVTEPPPPGPTRAELIAERDAEEQAAFEAIPADAAIATWLPYTKYGTPEDRLRVAMDHIQSREGMAVELGALMTGEDNERAGSALRMIGRFEVIDPALNEQVAAAGQKIASMIRAFNDTPAEQDPRMQGAADVAVRFGEWMEAVRTLRKHVGGDFTQELGKILELSRVREDSDCMRRDVRRVASYYMKEWAGLEPMPGDPKPR